MEHGKDSRIPTFENPPLAPFYQNDPDSKAFASTPCEGEAKKRTRVKLSCAECRRLKLKCSRGEWPCESCVRRGCEHLCPDMTMQASGRSSRVRDQKQIEELKARVEELEQALQSRQHLPVSDQPSPTDRLAQRYGSEQSGDMSASDVLIGTVGSLTIAEEGSSRFVGPSGASAYRMNDSDHSSDDDDIDENTSVISSLQHSRHFPFDGLKLTWLQLCDALPRKEHAVALANSYFKYVSLLYEPVQRSVFFGVYIELPFSPDSSIKHIKHIEVQRLAVVYAVLALGAYFDVEAPAPRIDESRSYFRAAQHCLSASHFMLHPTIASVECLQLLASYTFNTYKQAGEMSWQICGMMVRSLSALGLHRDAASFDIQQPSLDQRRALFFDSLLLEHQQALILGRPYSLQPAHYDVRTPEGLGLDWHEKSLGSEDSVFHGYKWQFLQLMIKVADVGLAAALPHDRIRYLDAELKQFMASLPPQLQYSPNVLQFDPLDEVSLHKLLQQHSMTMLIHESMLNLHRRHYTQALVTCAEPLTSPYAESVIVIILEVCKTILELIGVAQRRYPRLAKRFAILHLHGFGAGVCLAMLCIRASTSLLAEYAAQQLQAAHELLYAASTESAFAAELAPRLKALQDQALSALSRADQPVPVTETSKLLQPNIIARLREYGFFPQAPRTSPPVNLQPYPATHSQAFAEMPSVEPKAPQLLGNVVSPSPYYMMAQNNALWRNNPASQFPTYAAVHSDASMPPLPSPYAEFSSPLSDYFSHLLPASSQEGLTFDNISAQGTGLYDQMITDSLRSQNRHFSNYHSFSRY